MKIKSIENKPISFGIYKKTIATSYGHKMIGTYKGKNILIHYDVRDNTKMFYITNSLNRWLKSKLIYFQNGIKKTIWSFAQK